MDIWHEVIQSVFTPPPPGVIASYVAALFIVWTGVIVIIMIRLMLGLRFADSRAVATGLKLTAILSVAHVGWFIAIQILMRSLQLGADKQKLSPIESLALETDQLMLRLIAAGVMAAFMAIMGMMCWNMFLGKHKNALNESTAASTLSQP